jgi:arsenate reductase
MAKLTIYHNPRCSKSRAAMKLIEDEGYEAEVILYLEEPPSQQKLDELLTAMGREPLEAMRTNEKAFKELGLSKTDQRSRREWIKLMVENPVLIERPIVVRGKKAVLGRPVDDIEKLL